jgi:hypothetical protein
MENIVSMKGLGEVLGDSANTNNGNEIKRKN